MRAKGHPQLSLEISTQGSAPHPRLPHRYPRDQEPKAGKGPNPSPATHVQHTRLWGFVTEHGGGVSLISCDPGDRGGMTYQVQAPCGGHGAL